MSYALNNVTAPDNYTPGSTIENVPIQSIVIQVANQSVYYQLKTGIGGSINSGQWESTEAALLPGSTPISTDELGELVGIRFRAVIPLAQLPAGSSQAVVSVRTSP